MLKRVHLLQAYLLVQEKVIKQGFVGFEKRAEPVMHPLISSALTGVVGEDGHYYCLVCCHDTTTNSSFAYLLQLRDPLAVVPTHCRMHPIPVLFESVVCPPSRNAQLAGLFQLLHYRQGGVVGRGATPSRPSLLPVVLLIASTTLLEV